MLYKYNLVVNVILSTMTIRNVTIIYNPNSTGPGHDNAKKFAERLSHAGLKVNLKATDHPGHGYEIARQVANNSPSAMIISSSGDGGYHEVVNGVLDSRHPQVVTGVLPSGNANDHYHALHRGNTIRRIVTGDIDTIDVLKLTYGHRHRYAHSYIGLGLTSQIGEVLTRAKLNPLVESWLVCTHLFKIRPVKIRHDGHIHRYDHLVLGNIDRMSKYMKLSKTGTYDDGKFEVVKIREGSFIGLIGHLLRSVIGRKKPAYRVANFAFETLRPLTIQLDGEALQLAESTRVRVESRPQVLSTIV